MTSILEKQSTQALILHWLALNKCKTITSYRLQDELYDWLFNSTIDKIRMPSTIDRKWRQLKGADGTLTVVETDNPKCSEWEIIGVKTKTGLLPWAEYLEAFHAQRSQ